LSSLGGIGGARPVGAPDTEETAAAASTSAQAAAGPSLEIGSRGEDVRALQQQLVRLGKLAGGTAAADGIYGRMTQSAVAAFQRSAGLTPTGTADPATRASLARAAGGGTPPAPPAGAKPNDILFLGMGKDTRHEVNDLKARGVKVLGINDSAKPDEVTLKVGGRTQTYDLTKDAEIDRYVRDIGVSGAKAREAASIIKGSGADARDETAQVVKAFAEAERGDRKIERLVLSGHSVGSGVWGDENGFFELETMKKVSQAFPRAAGQVEDFLVAGCYSSSENHVQQFREMFPNLKTSMAYGDSAPGTWSGAMVHNKAWEEATRGSDPGKVTRDIVAGTRKGENVATWNIEDGYQADGPQKPLAELRAELARTDPATRPFFTGEQIVADTQSGPLRDSYRAIQRLLGSRQLPASERPALEARRDATIRVIFYDALVKGKFQEAYGGRIQAGFAALGLVAPDFSKLSRKDALASVAAFESALAARNPKPAAAQALRPLLTDGLKDLKPSVIPNSWV